MRLASVLCFVLVAPLVSFSVGACGRDEGTSDKVVRGSGGSDKVSANKSAKELIAELGNTTTTRATPIVAVAPERGRGRADIVYETSKIAKLRRVESAVSAGGRLRLRVMVVAPGIEDRALDLRCTSVVTAAPWRSVVDASTRRAPEANDLNELVGTATVRAVIGRGCPAAPRERGR